MHPRDEDVIFSEIKDDKGKILPVYAYAPTPVQAEAEYQLLSSVTYLNTHTNRLAVEFNPLKPNLGSKGVTIRVVPNSKLTELFQSSGPNITPAMIAKMDNVIEKKIEPYDMRIVPGGPEEPSELTSLAQREANDAEDNSEGSKVRKPHWLTHGDKEEENHVWGFLMLRSNRSPRTTRVWSFLK